MSSKLMIVDGNNLYSRGYFIAKSQTRDPFELCADMVINLREKFPEYRLAFTFDTTKSTRRLALYPEYKGNRKSSMTEDEYKSFKEGCNNFLKLVKFSGFLTFFGEGYEADDYIACLAAMAKARYQIVILSTDRDLLQLIDRTTRVYEPMKGLFIDENNFKNVFEMDLKYFLDYKCIVGDSSDNVNGIEQLGDVRAKKLIAQYGNINAIYNALMEKKPLTKIEEKFLAGIKSGLLDRNMQLLDLRYAIRDKELQQHTKRMSTPDVYDEEKLHKLLATIGRGHMTVRWVSECLRK